MASPTLPQSRQQVAVSISEVRNVLANEATIDILPMGYVSWTGTSAQLEAEHILPPGFDWATADGRSWTTDRLEYQVTRRKPQGMTQMEWRAGPRDHWSVLVAGWPLHAAKLHAAKEGVRQLEWLITEAATVQQQRLYSARDDGAFQALLRCVGAGK